MAEHKHTPGPWQVTAGGHHGEIVRAADATGKPIASMWMNGDSMTANARLIAAAPDLLAACQEALTSGLEDMHPESVRIIRAAFAKATLTSGERE